MKNEKAGDDMQWSDLYQKGQAPSDHQIKAFVNNPLLDELTDYLQEAYHVGPTVSYSGCTMQQGFFKGWNVKFKKSGKSLCTIYPKQGYFIALIPIGAKEIAEADLLMPLCDGYTQTLYSQTKMGSTGKSLPVEVTSGAILCDVKHLIALRARSHKK